MKLISCIKAAIEYRKLKQSTVTTRRNGGNGKIKAEFQCAVHLHMHFPLPFRNLHLICTIHCLSSGSFRTPKGLSGILFDSVKNLYEDSY